MGETSHLTLMTPATGFPDLEAKIAFGLAWIVGQAGDVDEVDYELEPQPAYYLLHVTGNGRLGDVDTLVEAINAGFREVASRYLAAESLYYLPGIQSKYRKNYPSVNKAGGSSTTLKPEFDAARLDQVYSLALPGVPEQLPRLPGSHNMCGHDLPAFGGSQGLILGVSSHAGKPYKRDAAGNRFNLGLCSICGSMAVLGTTWASFRGLAGPRERPSQQATVIVDLIPRVKLCREQLEGLFAAQKDAEGAYLGPFIPVGLFPLLFLARFPQSAEVVKQAEAELHVTRFDPSSRGQERMAGQEEIAAYEVASFVAASPFNAATVENLVDPKGDAVAIEGLQALMQALTAIETRERQEGMARFAREYHEFTLGRAGSPAGAGLYRKTFEYLTQAEVTGVSQEIIEEPAVNQWAEVLRYFANQGNYGFVDAVRTAKDLAALREVVFRSFRQLLSDRQRWEKRLDDAKRQGIPLQPLWREQAKSRGIPPRPLSPEELQRLWQLADDDRLRPELQLYVAAAALTRALRRFYAEDTPDSSEDLGEELEPVEETSDLESAEE